jgi:hypothetical protein
MIQGDEARAMLTPLQEQASDQQEDRGEAAQRSQQQKEQDGRMVVDQEGRGAAQHKEDDLAAEHLQVTPTVQV